MEEINKLLQILDGASFRVGRQSFLADLFECGAIAISNRFDTAKAESREETYMQIMKKYDPKTQQIMCNLFGEIAYLLSHQTENGFYDYLGALYMASETSSNKTGQFFTPYHLSKLCAKTSIEQSIKEHKMVDDEIYTIHEPTCGSGGMILAAADVLWNDYGIDYTKKILAVCGDLDKRCVHMAFVQLSLSGIPSVILHKDGLTNEIWDIWKTPAYILQHQRFKHIKLKGE